MSRRLSIVISCGVHAIALALVLGYHARRTPTTAPRSGHAVTRIELVDPPPAPKVDDERPGGHPPAPTPTSARARTPRPARAARRAITPDPRGTVRIEAWDGEVGGGDEGTGGGTGGAGGGTGYGFGLGTGAPIARFDRVPAAPPAPRASRARPPRLIYPARRREVDDGETFIARVIVDADGYVAGARMVRGFGRRRDEVASALVWKFRYAPALDDDGRPIRATVDQRFLVE